MKKFNFGFITAMVILSLLAFTCKKEEEETTEPPTKGSVRGTVIDNETEMTIANAIVYTEPGSFQTSTTEYGDYYVKDVEPKDYKVFCYKEGYDTVSTSINVSAGVESKASFRLIPSDTTIQQQFGGISGSVLDYNSELPIDKVTIKTDPASAVTLTNSSGLFTINNLSPGTYKVTADKKDYKSSEISVQVTTGNITEANFSLSLEDALDTTKFGKIIGKVKDAFSSDPIGNVNVYTIPSTNSVSSSENGDYVIKNMSEGTYKVIAQKNEYIGDTTEVVVKIGLESTANLFLTTSTGMLEGLVIKATDGVPVNKATIKTDPTTTSLITDADGKFLFDKLDPGTYKIITSAASFVNDTTSVVIKEGVKIFRQIILERE